MGELATSHPDIDHLNSSRARSYAEQLVRRWHLLAHLRLLESSRSRPCCPEAHN